MPTTPETFIPRWLRGKKQASRETKDSNRLSAAKRGYGRPWQRVRKLILAQNPLCLFCNQAGRTTLATEVDHIDGNSFNNDEANLRPLCKSCHSARTAKDQAFGRKSRTPGVGGKISSTPTTVDRGGSFLDACAKLREKS